MGTASLISQSGFGPVLAAGVAAGFAAWTKNEGLLFWVALGLAYLITVRDKAEWSRRLRLLPPFAGGILLIFTLVGHFKVHQAPANDLVNASNMHLFGARMADLSRYWATFWALIGELLTFGGILLPPVVVLGVWLALVRFRPQITGAHLLPITAATLQLAGYFAIYVLTPQDLDWQLNTSLSRLLLHLWPLLVTGIFMISGNIFEKPTQLGSVSARSK